MIKIQTIVLSITMATIIILVINLVVSINNGDDEVIKEVMRIAESAYMEGQVDALTGDIRVTETDSSWVYHKSPWDNKSMDIVTHKEQMKVD